MVPIDEEVAGARDDDLDAEIDDASRNKYGRYGPRFIDPMVASPPRETTLKLIPSR